MIPVVWLLGTSGVGKSTTGHRMLSALDDAGVRAAFVDADQLRLASGVPASETELVAAALPALGRGYRERGARVLVVAGLADDADHLARLLPGVPRDRVLAVLLDADAGTIRARVRRRGWQVELAEDAVAHAARLDPAWADLHVRTAGRDPTELAARIAGSAAAHLAAQPPGPPEPTHDRAGVAVPRRVVVLTGPGGAGVSTVGYRTFSRLARAGEPVGYVDAHQLGFLGADGDGGASLRTANTRAVVATLAGGGAATVVVSGDPRAVGGLAGPGSGATVWLHASAPALAERITARARGDGPPIPGDHRLGLTGPALDVAIADAVRDSERDGLRPAGAHVVDTTGRTPDEVAERVVACAGVTPVGPGQQAAAIRRR